MRTAPGSQRRSEAIKRPLDAIKKIRPRISPRPDLYGARFTSDRAAISFHIATTVADVKLSTHSLGCSL
jgi:hypothetical protein